MKSILISLCLLATSAVQAKQLTGLEIIEKSKSITKPKTGVTEVGIDNLEITTVPGPNSTETSTVNFTITQPNAADFPDQIVNLILISETFS